MNVFFIDTSVFLNIVDVPNRNEHRKEVIDRLSALVKDKDNNTLILPFATIVETGNHIAHCDNGGLRRDSAKRFSEIIMKTVKEEAPWTYYGQQFDIDDLVNMCNGFPDAAMRGVGIGDLSIIQAYEKYKQNAVSVNRLCIWSLDDHLSSYDEQLLPLTLRNKR